jgi:hypothetical protein
MKRERWDSQATQCIDRVSSGIFHRRHAVFGKATRRSLCWRFHDAIFDEETPPQVIATRTRTEELPGCVLICCRLNSVLCGPPHLAVRLLAKLQQGLGAGGYTRLPILFAVLDSPCKRCRCQSDRRKGGSSQWTLGDTRWAAVSCE